MAGNFFGGGLWYCQEADQKRNRIRGCKTIGTFGPASRGTCVTWTQRTRQTAIGVEQDVLQHQ